MRWERLDLLPSYFHPSVSSRSKGSSRSRVALLSLDDEAFKGLVAAEAKEPDLPFQMYKNWHLPIDGREAKTAREELSGHFIFRP